MGSSDFHDVVCAVLVQKGRVLLVHRNAARAWAPNTWDAPGGHIEEGESDPQAMARELLEELGLRIRPETLVLVGRLRGPEYDARVFRVGAFAGKPANEAPHEHDRISWFSENELEQLNLADPQLLPYLHAALHDLK